MSVRTETGERSRADEIPSSGWRADVEVRARQLEQALEVAKRCHDQRTRESGGCFDTYAKLVADETERARTATRPPNPSRRFLQWLSGAALETAWRSLHNADAALIMITPTATLEAQLPEIRAALSTVLGKDDGRVTEYTAALKSYQGQANGHREQIRVIKQTINAASDIAHANVRSYRNWLFGIALIVSLVLAVVGVAHAFDDSFLLIEVGKIGHNADVGQIQLAGAVGGLLTALFALIRLNVYSGPFNLPFWQALIRIPAGAAAALVGVMLLQGKLLSTFGAATRTGELLAYAVLFGAAPDIVLRFLDNEVNKVSSAARTTNDPLKAVPQQT